MASGPISTSPHRGHVVRMVVISGELSAVAFRRLSVPGSNGATPGGPCSGWSPPSRGPSPRPVSGECSAGEIAHLLGQLRGLEDLRVGPDAKEKTRHPPELAG